MIKLFNECVEIIEKSMIGDEFKPLLYFEYKENSKQLVKLCDLLDLFGGVNSQLVKSEDEKLRLKKRTRRIRMTQLFRNATACLVSMQDIFKNVKVKPANGTEHSLWSYYFGLGDFERLALDSVNNSANKSVATFERMLPIIVKDDRESIIKLRKIVQEFTLYCKYAMKPLRCFNQRSSCFCCFRSLFGETKQMGLILKKTFEGYHRWVRGAKGIKLDAMFFAATTEMVDDNVYDLKYKDLPTYILCNPNAMNYQHMVNQPHAYYLRYFLNKDINVLVWNYRGFGRSNGKPNPDNLRHDGQVMLDYLRNTLGIRGKVGVYGRSLGGIATTYLADRVDMIIADRTFCNFQDLAVRKFYGRISKYLFKVGSCNWIANNDYNMVSRGSEGTCYKVVVTDKNDEVVDMQSSLMVGVSNMVATVNGKQPIFTNIEMKHFITTIRFITNLEHDLYQLIDYEQKKPIQLTNSRSVDELIQTSQSSNVFNHKGKVIPDNEKGAKVNDTNDIKIKFVSNNKLPPIKSVIQKIRKDLQLDSLMRQDQDELPQFVYDLWILLNEICTQMFEISGGMLYFHDIININKMIDPCEIESFFNLMEVYGSSCQINESNLSVFDHQEKRMIAANQIDDLCRVISDQIDKVNTMQHENVRASRQTTIVSTHCKDLLNHFSKVNFLFASKFVPNKRMIQESSQQQQLKSVFPNFEEPSPFIVGHIIPVKCGHTGHFSAIEAHVLDQHMKAAGFVLSKGAPKTERTSLIMLQSQQKTQIHSGAETPLIKVHLQPDIRLINATAHSQKISAKIEILTQLKGEVEEEEHKDDNGMENVEEQDDSQTRPLQEPPNQNEL